MRASTPNDVPRYTESMTTTAATANTPTDWPASPPPQPTLLPATLPETLCVLGIDPGLGRTGFGVVCWQRNKPYHTPVAQSWGLLETAPNTPIAQRLQELYTDFTSLVSTVRPHLAVVEQLFYFRNATTLIPVAQARGVLLLVLQQHGVPYAEYTPMQVKQALTGYGKASKADMQQAVMQRLNLRQKPRPDDAADGLALALTHWQLAAAAGPLLGGEE